MREVNVDATVKLEAAVLALLLAAGIVDSDEVFAWALRQIDAAAAPTAELSEVALGASAGVMELVARLQAIAGAGLDEHAVKRGVMTQLWRAVRAERERRGSDGSAADEPAGPVERRAIRALWTLSLERLPWSAAEERAMGGLDDAYQLAEQRVLGTFGDVRREAYAILERYADG